MLIKPLLLVVVASAALSSPLPSKKLSEGRILYDQRQEGEWNVRADLKDFVILIIPTQTAASTPSPAPGGLLDFLSKAVPMRPHHTKRFHHHPKKEVVQETQHFIESKTAPYHVDISTSRSLLAKLHPEPVVVKGEEVVIAKSPSVAMVKQLEERDGKALVLTVNSREESAVEKLDEKKKDNKKKVKDEKKTELKLLGAENEQCGPGLERDSEGVCRIIKNKQ